MQKYSFTSLGLDLATIRLAAYCLNHYSGIMYSEHRHWMEMSVELGAPREKSPVATLYDAV
jgi:hypothetical protein